MSNAASGSSNQPPQENKSPWLNAWYDPLSNVKTVTCKDPYFLRLTLAWF